MNTVPGWQLYQKERQSLSLVRIKDWLLDGQRIITEIIRRHDDSNNVFLYNIRSQGCSVDVNDIINAVKLGQLNSAAEEEVQLLTKFMSTSDLCKGVKLDDSCGPCYGENRVTIYTSSCDPDVRALRAFSPICKVICPPGSRCCDCSRSRKVELQKEKRAKSRTTII